MNVKALIARLIYPETSIQDYLSTISSPGFLDSLSIETVKSEGVYPLLCHRLKQIYHSLEASKDNASVKNHPLFVISQKAGYQHIARELDMASGLENALRSLNGQTSMSRIGR